MSRALGVLLVAALAAACGGDDGPRDDAGGAPAVARFDPEALRFPGADLVLISMDTLRADRLGAYGYERGTTPEIDAFADQAIVFEEAYSNSPKTASSHMTLFTSRLPSVHKVRNQSARLNLTSPVLASNRPTLAQLLNRAGYLNAGLAGGANLAPQMGFAKGFQGRFVSQLVDFSEQVKQAAATYRQMRNQPQPAFLFVHSYQVHGPYLPPRELQERFVRTESPVLAPRIAAYTGLPRREQWRVMNKESATGQPAYWEGKEQFGPAEAGHLSDLYDAAIADMDASMGVLFNRLENLGAYDRAIVVLLSDHGEEFFEHGDFEHDQLHREHLHVPLMIRLPGGHLGGTRVRGMAQLLDVLPTLLDLLELEAPADLEGRSLVDALRSGRVGEERPVVSEHVMFPDDYRASLRSRAGHVIFHAVPGRLEGFDLRADPGETTDVYAGDPRLKGLGEQLKAALAMAFQRRDLLDEADAGGTLGDSLAADDRAALTDELNAMGYFGTDDPPEVDPASLGGTPLESWPADG